MFHLLLSIGYEPGSQNIRLITIIIYLSLICWLINQVHKAVAKKIVAKPPLVRNINTHLYSIKLLRNNSITLLYLYESLNYKSNLMRNDYYILKNDARCRSRFVIIIIKKKKAERTTRNYRTLKSSKLKIRSYRTLRHRQALWFIIVIQHYNCTH